MEVVPTMRQKAKEDTYVSWVDIETFAIIFIFSREGSLERVFMKWVCFLTKAY